VDLHEHGNEPKNLKATFEGRYVPCSYV